jgi:hypothetical protein
MIAIIRDDDLNISCSIDDIEKAYSGIINKVPVNFFVIPELINPQKNWAKQYGDFFWKTFSNEGLFVNNKELINYLKLKIKDKSIGIGMHGIHHHYKEMEFLIDEMKIPKNIQLINDELDINLKCFSSPNNSINSTNSEIIGKYFEYLFVSYSHKFYERKMSYSNLYYFFIFSINRIFSLSKEFYFSPRKINNLKEISSIPISYVSSESKTISLLKKINPNKDGIICLATHYYDLIHNTSTKDLLLKSISILESKGVKFINVNQLK